MWQFREDTQNIFVKKAIARDTFEKVIKFLYFVEPDDLDPDDPFWKVRPLFDQINR